MAEGAGKRPRLKRQFEELKAQLIENNSVDAVRKSLAKFSPADREFLLHRTSPTDRKTLLQLSVERNAVGLAHDIIELFVTSQVQQLKLKPNNFIIFICNFKNILTFDVIFFRALRINNTHYYNYSRTMRACLFVLIIYLVNFLFAYYILNI